MSSDINYQVVRKFDRHSIGEVLPSTAFASAHRAAQLIDQRFLAPAASTAVQPTVKALVNATVRKSSEMAAQVQDSCVLEAAMALETREAVRKVFAKRLEELHDQSDN